MINEYRANLILLILNLLFLASKPIVLSVNNSFFALGLLTFLLLLSVWVNKWNSKNIMLKLALVLINVIFAFMFFYNDTLFSKVSYIVSMLVLMIYSLIVQFNIVLKIKTPDATIIFSSINFYLIAGYTAACAVWFTETIHPNSFLINNPVNSHQLFDYVYFSFVTMATLGYGDIIPANEIGKTLAIFISLFGQLFVTIFLVITLSKYLKHKDNN